MYLAKVHVTLKPTVNDPQGLTIKGALHDLDFQNVSSVRVGKYMEVVLDEKSRAKAETQIEDMCRRLLANLVIERYRFELEEVSS
jgi:phosphoribosylformylglycinamidine synthase PurS subunit